MKKTNIILLFAFFAMSTAALAGCGKGKQEEPKPADTQQVSAAPEPAPAPVDTAAKKPEQIFNVQATVTAINEAKSKITIDHEKMDGYMAAMEMPYKVTNPEVFKKVKVGTKGQFKIEVTGGNGVITDVHVQSK